MRVCSESGWELSAKRTTDLGLSRCLYFLLLGCRTLLALLGVHFIHIQDTRCVLNVFPQGSLDQIIRRFQKDNPGAQEPARLMFRTRGSLIEQRAMWTILLRVLNVAKLPAAVKKDTDAIVELEQIGRFHA